MAGVTPETLDTQKRAIFACMRSHLSSCDSDSVMKAQLHQCLMRSGVTFWPDVRLADNAGAIDFLSELGYAVLVIALREGLSDVFLRVRTIVADDRVKQVLVLTPRAAHRKLPGGIGGKPVDVFWIGGVS